MTPEVLASNRPETQGSETVAKIGKREVKAKDFAKFSKAIKSGESIYSSMLAAGFPNSIAKMGIRRLPAKFQKVVLQERRRNISLARQFAPSELKDYVIGGLITNTLDGNDSAVRSYELLGKTRDLNLFTPDQQLGIVNVVLQNKPDSVPVLELPPEE